MTLLQVPDDLGTDALNLIERLRNYLQLPAVTANPTYPSNTMIRDSLAILERFHHLDNQQPRMTAVTNDLATAIVYFKGAQEGFAVKRLHR